MTFILLFLIGILAGALAGLLGIGGGLIFTPVLLFFFSGHDLEQAPQWAIGSSLFCTFIASQSSALKQYLNRNLFFRDSVKLGISGAIGTIAGTAIATSPWYSMEYFSVLFSLLLLYSARNLINRRTGNTYENQPAREMTVVSALIIGLAGGLVASLAGVGGGIVLVPLMSLLLRLPFSQAVSTSSGAIVIISLAAWVQMALAQPLSSGITDVTLGFIDFGSALPIIAGSLPGGFFGVQFSHRLPVRALEIGFAVLLIVMAVRLLYEGLWP